MKTIFVNGCFDILHNGHIKLFKYAKSLGNKLIVAIDSDMKVAQDKGGGRPINSLEDRVYILESIRFIDEVHHFNTPIELENLIKIINPHILVVGSDWKGKKIIGGHYAKKIIYFDRIKQYSTTKIIDKIITN